MTSTAPAVIAADRECIDLAVRALATAGYPLDDAPFMLLRPPGSINSASAERPPTLAEAAERAGLPRPLSTRELQVLGLVAHGMDNPEIARNLGIERCTVKTHLARICRVLGAVDRAHAAYLALSHGLLAWSLP